MNVLNVNGLRVLRFAVFAIVFSFLSFNSETLSVGVASDAQKPALKVLMLGDSLTAGYGLGAGETIPDKLQAALLMQGIEAQIINGGVSGDTTAGGLARMDWLFADGPPDVLVIELGANDGLRAIDPEATSRNLEAAIQKGVNLGVVVVLTGMQAPPNLGESYVKAFNAIFPNLAARYPVIFYPFFLENVAGDITLNQADGIHPNSDGVDVIVKTFLPTLLTAIHQVHSTGQ